MIAEIYCSAAPQPRASSTGQNMGTFEQGEDGVEVEATAYTKVDFIGQDRVLSLSTFSFPLTPFPFLGSKVIGQLAVDKDHKVRPCKLSLVKQNMGPDMFEETRTFPQVKRDSRRCTVWACNIFTAVKVVVVDTSGECTFLAKETCFS